MQKHILLTICIFMQIVFCNSSFGKDSLIIMTPYMTGMEKAYVLSLTDKDSKQVIFSEGISANFEKGRLNIVYTNAIVSINYSESRPVSVRYKECNISFPRDFKIIIDGRIFPFEKISGYLDNPVKFNREEALRQQKLSRETEATANNIDCIHEASAGDTLDSIAAMYSLSIDDLKNANKKIKEIKPGTEVIIPGNVKNAAQPEKSGIILQK